MSTLTLSDYITLRDGSQRFDGTPNAVVLSFDLPGDFVKGTLRAMPVLQFKMKVHQPTDLAIYVNQDNANLNEAHTVTLAENEHARSYHEFIRGDLFKPGESNEIKFILMDHSIIDQSNNDLTISDVMLTFQRRVEV